MKLTDTIVKEFEKQQKSHGTKIAIYNLLWQVGAGILKDLGIKHIHTSEKVRKA